MCSKQFSPKHTIFSNGYRAFAALTISFIFLVGLQCEQCETTFDLGNELSTTSLSLRLRSVQKLSHQDNCGQLGTVIEPLDLK